MGLLIYHRAFHFWLSMIFPKDCYAHLFLSNGRPLDRLRGPQRAKLLLELYLLQQRVGEQFAKSNILALKLLECADLLPRRQGGKAGRIDF